MLVAIQIFFFFLTEEKTKSLRVTCRNWIWVWLLERGTWGWRKSAKLKLQSVLASMTVLTGAAHCNAPYSWVM